MLHVADTNLLLHPTPRRFLLGAAGYREEPVLLAPTVAFELERNLPVVESLAWERRARESDAHMPEGQTRAMRQATGTAALRWLQEEMERPDSPLKCMVLFDSEISMAARAIRRGIPDEAFVVRGTKDNPNGDEMVVSEAIAYGADLLLTNNVQTLDHRLLNAWASKEHGYNHPFLCDADTGLGMVLEGNFMRDAHWVACCMSVSGDERPDDAQTQSFLRFVHNLRQAFPRTACAMRAYELQEDGAEIRRSARAAIQEDPRWNLVRDCEMRRVSAVRKAALECGWQIPEPPDTPPNAGGMSR